MNTAFTLFSIYFFVGAGAYLVSSFWPSPPEDLSAVTIKSSVFEVLFWPLKVWPISTLLKRRKLFRSGLKK